LFQQLSNVYQFLICPRGNTKKNKLAEVLKMHELLFEELRQFELEIVQSLQKKKWNSQLKTILEAELADIRLALNKVENGKFGLCELSGEFIPENLLKLIPTIKSVKDVNVMDTFYRKPIQYHS
jgi:RNA polymerase-binding transcription factor DksA